MSDEVPERSDPMRITVGQWEDVLSELDRLRELVAGIRAIIEQNQGASNGYLIDTVDRFIKGETLDIHGEPIL